MSVFRKMYKATVVWLVNHVFDGTRFFGLKRRLLNSCKGISVGKNTKIVAPITFPLTSNLEIGEDCWVGAGFQMYGNSSVIIGDRCDIAPNVTFVTGSHKIGSEERRAGEGYNGEINIGNGVWLCANVVIIPDTYIEDGVVVAAGAVAKKRLLQNKLYAGNPIQYVKDL